MNIIWDPSGIRSARRLSWWQRWLGRRRLPCARAKRVVRAARAWTSHSTDCPQFAPDWEDKPCTCGFANFKDAIRQYDSIEGQDSLWEEMG